MFVLHFFWFRLPTPETEEIVKESIKEGLPIIPFAYPTFFSVSQRQEEDTKQRRESVRRQMHLPNFVKEYGEVEEDSIFLMDDDNDNDNDVDLHQSLDSIVRRAKFEMENKVHPRKESQSSYVEMCLKDELESKENPNIDDEESDYFMMDKRRATLSDFYHSVQYDGILENPKNIKKKGSLIENEICRRFKKANRHKDDYVMFDFETDNNANKEYVEMGFSKKWHFLDFSKKCKK